VVELKDLKVVLEVGVLCGKGQFFSQGVSSPLFITATEDKLISKL
jgi:hypothetical protein